MQRVHLQLNPFLAAPPVYAPGLQGTHSSPMWRGAWGLSAQAPAFSASNPKRNKQFQHVKNFVMTHGRRPAAFPDRLVVGADAPETPDLRTIIQQAGLIKPMSFERVYDLAWIDKAWADKGSSYVFHWLKSEQPVMVIEAQDFSLKTHLPLSRARLTLDAKGQVLRSESTENEHGVLMPRDALTEDDLLMANLVDVLQRYESTHSNDELLQREVPPLFQRARVNPYAEPSARSDSPAPSLSGSQYERLQRQQLYRQRRRGSI